jgi:hypothetical protein
MGSASKQDSNEPEGAVATDTEVLAMYEAARDDVLTNGYSISANGREWRRDDLNTLEKWIDHYRARVSRGTGSILDRARTGIPHRGW